MRSSLIQIKPQPDFAHREKAMSLEIALEPAFFVCRLFDVAQRQHRPTKIGISGYLGAGCMT
jgi:hypothetical protein